jgi:exodeoxyribonuclease VII small subunit
MAEATSFEEKLEKSQQILDKLGQPDITLEESVKFFNEGMKIIQEAQEQLDKAELTFKTIQEENA